MVDSGQGHPVSVGSCVGRGDRRMDHEPAAYGGGCRGGDAALCRVGATAVAGTFGGVDDSDYRGHR